jgi:metal-responsive CopG/Arc/MetJ family transcriptional regulator
MRPEATMKQEIVELDDLLVIEAQHVAQQHGKTFSEAVAAALREWIEANRQPTRQLSCAGIIDVDWSPTPEEIDRELMEGLDPIEGWSPDRRDLRFGSSSDASN